MNNNAEFYDKLLRRIVFAFCFLFFIFINILQFFQLQAEEKPIEQVKINQPLYLSLVLFQANDQTPMIFLQDRINHTYFQALLKKIDFKTHNSISFINCAPNTFSALKKEFTDEFPNQKFSEESCDITLNRLQELYNKKTLIIAVLKNQNLKHAKALNFAYQNKLKPKVQNVEIRNEI